MANIYRLIFTVFVLSFALLSSAAESVSVWTSSAVYGMSFGSPAEICIYAHGSESGFVPVKITNENYVCKRADGIVGADAVLKSKSCPANSTLLPSGQCACNPDFVDDGVGSCKPAGPKYNAKSLCETFAAVEGMMGGMRGSPQSFAGELEHGSKVCVPGGWGDGIPENQGCRMEFDRTMLASNPDGTKTSYGSLEMSGTAADPKDYSCTAGDGTDGKSEPPKPPKPDCENGSKGTVNGLEVCVPRQADNGVETGDKKTTTTNNGTDTTKKVDDSKTVCVNGKCTTTTTTTTTVTNNSTGTSTTSTATNSTEIGKGEFCKSNPKDAQCNGTGTGTGGGQTNGDGEGEGDKDPSQFGGSCAAGFACKGDAIQCAIAHQQHLRACKLFDDPSPESLLYESDKNKTGNQTNDLDGNETIDLAGRIDQTDLLGGGAGVSDLAITVAGTNVSLPFSKLNPYLSAFGNLLVAVSLLLAFRIVGRG